MAIYNPKRARELEAAARLAESQRQRELAKGQREQRSTEQILGLVEGLIGAAPQVVGGLQDLQAQQVLAGEKPLPEQKPKSDDILENIGRFITDPFEAGVRQKARTMAAEQKGPRLQAAEPLLREAIQKPGIKQEFAPEAKTLADIGFTPKEVTAQLGADPREAAMKQLMRDPALAMLPEREREAAIAGLQQRMTAEQAAAERQRKLDEAQITRLTAGATKAAGGELPQAKQLRQAAGGDAVIAAAKLEDEINTVGSPELTGQTMTNVRQLAEQAYAARGGDPNSLEGASAVSSIVKDIYKTYRKKDFSPKDYEFVENSVALDRELVELNDLRKKVKFEPTQAQIVRERISGVRTILKTEEIASAVNDLEKLGEFTEDQIVYLRLALQTKNTLIKASNDGYNVTNADYPRLSEIVADPMTPDEVWEGVVSGTRRAQNKRAKDRFDIVSAGRTAPESIRRAIESLDFPEVALTGEKETVLKDVPGEIGGALSDLFTLLAQAGLSATGVDDAINMASNSNDPTLKSAAEAARTMVEMFTGMGKKPQEPATPQTSQQQMQKMQALPADYVPVNKTIPAGQFLVGYVDPDEGPVDMLVKDLGPFLEKLSRRGIEGRILNNEMQGR
jgi:thioredoxin reductase